MIKKNLFIFIFSILMVFSLIGQIFASFSSLNVYNEFKNGIVDIDVIERQSENNVNKQAILPFDEIYKNMYIANKGADCYVRTKLVFSNENIAKDANIIGMNDDWTLNDDGYYYYTKILKNNENIDIFKAIKLGDIDMQYQLSDFDVNVEVNAIQSANFFVDFSSPNPWGEVEILKVDNENSNIKEYTPAPDTTFKVIFKDDVKGMVKNFDSFFSDIGDLMPGDCYEDTLQIQNDTNRRQKIYFATQNTSNKEFLNKVSLKVFDEKDNLIFETNLGENKGFVIDTIHSQSNSKIKFRIEVLNDVDNKFASNTSSVKWFFSTEEIDFTIPQTGDNSHMGVYIALMLVSAIGLFFSIKGIKKHEKSN